MKPVALVSSGDRFQNLRFALFLIFVTVVMLGGGSAREDIFSLLYLRPFAIFCICAWMIIPGRFDFRPLRTPLLLLAGLAILTAFQLVPLPPEIWLELPGRDLYANAAIVAGVPQPWRPISLTPDLTFGNLVGLSVPLAAFVGIASLSRRQRQDLLVVLIGIACASALLGVIQRVTGADAFFLYEITHEGSAVGFFANRNHQALLLAVTFLLLGAWTMLRPRMERYRKIRLGAALGIGLSLIPLILITGSRAGMVLSLLAIALTAIMVASRKSLAAVWRNAATAKGALVALIAASLVGLSVWLDRAEAVQRLFAFENYSSELRIQYAPLTWRMLVDFFPVGSGFGSFDPVFRAYEPAATLRSFYFNRAHNDLVELGIGGGLPALLLLAMFTYWATRQAYKAFRGDPTRSDIILGRMAACVILILFLSSLVEYPLATPLMSVILVICSGWLAHGAGHEEVRAARSPAYGPSPRDGSSIKQAGSL